MCYVAWDSEVEHKWSLGRQGRGGCSSLGGKGGIVVFFIRPFVLKLLLSATHFYAPSQPPGEKAVIK